MAAGGATNGPEEHYRKLERMYLGAAANAFYSPGIEISEGAARVTIPVRPELHHAGGAVHGSVYFKALDDAAFFAANSLVRDVFIVTVSFTVYFTRPISSGAMTATGRVVHRSLRLLLAEAELIDARGRAIGRGSGSFMPSRIPLSPAIGYE